MKKCPYCFEEIQDEAVKCKHCQSMLTEQPAAEAPPAAQAPMPGYPPAPMPPRKKMSTGVLVTIILLCIFVPLAIIAVLVGYSTFKYHKRSQVKTTKLRVTRTLDAVLEWMNDPDMHKDGASACPGSLDELKGSYLKGDMLKDSWGNKLKISCTNDKVCIWSRGPNQRDENGAGDDIRACSEETGR